MKFRVLKTIKPLFQRFIKKLRVSVTRCLSVLKMKRLIFIGIICFCCLSSMAQNNYFSLKGSIVSADSLSPIQQAHILSELSHYGTTSDYEGKYSIQTRRIDTLRISSVGFVTKYININHDSIDANNLRITLQRDTIVLDEIDIIPYYNFSTVKEIVSTAPIEKPFIVKGVNDNIEDFLYQKPMANSLSFKNNKTIPSTFPQKTCSLVVLWSCGLVVLKK